MNVTYGAIKFENLTIWTWNCVYARTPFLTRESMRKSIQWARLIHCVKKSVLCKHSMLFSRCSFCRDLWEKQLLARRTGEQAKRRPAHPPLVPHHVGFFKFTHVYLQKKKPTTLLQQNQISLDVLRKKLFNKKRPLDKGRVISQVDKGQPTLQSSSQWEGLFRDPLPLKHSIKLCIGYLFQRHPCSCPKGDTRATFGTFRLQCWQDNIHPPYNREIENHLFTWLPYL